MTKYIRLFDGIYKVKEQIDDKYILFDKNGFGGTSFIYEKEKHRESDTILKLLDEIVVVEDNKHILTNTPYPLENNKTVYGAIWTDKGLIFVARLNMNNEWELA